MWSRALALVRPGAYGFTYAALLGAYGFTYAALLGACGFTHGALPTDASESTGDVLDGDLDAAVIDAAVIDAAEPPLCDSMNAALRACYTFDGNTLDGSSSNNDATASPLVLTVGRRGQALVTTSGTITVAGTSTLNVTALTIKMWIKPNALPATATRMGLLDSSSRYRMFLLPGGALRCALTNGADLTTSAGAVSANTWQRVACTVGAGQMRIYVNGTMVGILAAGAIPTSSAGMVIGHNNPSGENFNGAIDDLQVFGTVVAP